jgi:hypothetical protein
MVAPKGKGVCSRVPYSIRCGPSSNTTALASANALVNNGQTPAALAPLMRTVLKLMLMLEKTIDPT